MAMDGVPDNLFSAVPTAREAEWTEVLARGGQTRIERIVSHGQASPAGFWYDQAEHEWVALLSGGAVIEFETPARSVSLQPGDHLLIPAHTRHRVESTLPGVDTVWLAVFY